MPDGRRRSVRASLNFLDGLGRLMREPLPAAELEFITLVGSATFKGVSQQY